MSDDANARRAALTERMVEALWAAWDCPEEDDERLAIYVKAVSAVALEEAARVADVCPDSHWGPNIAAAIRSLKEKPEP